MKALVAVKRVVDYNVKVRVKSDQTGVDIASYSTVRFTLTVQANRPTAYCGVALVLAGFGACARCVEQQQQQRTVGCSGVRL